MCYFVDKRIKYIVANSASYPTTKYLVKLNRVNWYRIEQHLSAMAGIGRIEEKIKTKQEHTDKSISLAFQDMKQLMTMAKQMATLSKSLAQKMKEHGAQVTNDETVLLKSHLMELGVDQEFDLNISKSNYSSSDKYYSDLAKQIATIARSVMEKHKKDQITLSDVYCCFNRARGVNLLSPEDVRNACRYLNDMPDIGLRLVRYSSGLMVLQNFDSDIETFQQGTVNLVKQLKCMTPPQMALRLSIPVQLARQRLTECEKAGLLCRDESIEGLSFYPNRFLNPIEQDT